MTANGDFLDLSNDILWFAMSSIVVVSFSMSEFILFEQAMTAIHLTLNDYSLRLNDVCWLANQNLKAYYYPFCRVDLKVGIFITIEE